MGKSSHFSGQPLYCQVIKLLDKSKVLQISREKGSERYVKRFNGWGSSRGDALCNHHTL